MTSSCQKFELAELTAPTSELNLPYISFLMHLFFKAIKIQCIHSIGLNSPF